MAKRIRDHRQDYVRRVERGLAKGLSRSAARGHPRAGERNKPAGSRIVDPFSRLEMAVKSVRKGSSLRKAASEYRIGQERLRAYLKENTDARRVKGKWKISDQRSRKFPFYSQGMVVQPWMTPENVSEAGRYMQAVGWFLQTGNEALLLTFIGAGVRDENRRFYVFETDENTLFELDHRGEVAIPEQYRISNRSL
jgi:hypothetical protein